MATLERALVIAAEAHQGATDKGGAPYILHPLRLMHQMTTVDERIVALLHDVVEDSPWTLDALRAEGFSEEVVSAVDSLTRREGETYEDFIKRGAVNPLACRVKLADIEDNMDVRRLGEIGEKDLERLQRYQRARSVILEAMGENT
ncbi:MAG: HD domain-containing protein [Candidatus Hydrogenedentes bacterium]|nr:HD domain-containing protein [Candidatus Hydrogenedentota bacterium]